jgi:hypothetical protein
MISPFLKLAPVEQQTASSIQHWRGFYDRVEGPNRAVVAFQKDQQFLNQKIKYADQQLYEHRNTRAQLIEAGVDTINTELIRKLIF